MADDRKPLPPDARGEAPASPPRKIDLSTPRPDEPGRFVPVDGGEHEEEGRRWYAHPDAEPRRAPEEAVETEEEPYKVGYGKPPREHQWKKGQSGNPNRKPMRPATSKDIWKDVLNRPVAATIDGRPEQITLYQAIVTKTAQKALDGDRHALREVLKQAETIPKLGEREQTVSELWDEVTPEEVQLANEILEKYKDYFPPDNQPPEDEAD